MKYVKYDRDKLVNCECGETYKLGRKSDHLKTKKHNAKIILIKCKECSSAADK